MSESTAPALPTVHRTEIDGVPVLWSEAPGQPVFALQARVGRADERTHEGGLTHLVEHLAMSTLGQPRYDHNAWVDGTRTVFYANASPTDISAFAGTLSGALAGLPLDRLDHERGILKRESASAAPGVVDTHLNFRFGMTGHGLTGQPEFGLGSVTADRVETWTRERFNRGNVVAFMTAEPRADLRLGLVDGDRRPIPAPVPEPTTPIPSVITSPNDGVALGFLMPRRLGLGTFLALYHRMLRQRLRLERGLIYDVLADLSPLDADWAAALVGGECAPEHIKEVADIALDELDRLVKGDVDEGELRTEVAEWMTVLQDPTQVAGLLDSMVQDELAGRPYRSPEERYQEQYDITPQHIADMAAEARRSILIMAQIDPPAPDIVPYPLTSADMVSGREVKPLLSVMGFGPKIRLHIGPDGVSLRAKDGSLATVRYADCVLLERPNEEEIVVWGRDLSRVYIPAAFWRGGEEIVAEIIAAVPPELVVSETFSHDYIEAKD